MQPIEMDSSQKKIFSELFWTFFKFKLKFYDFQKKMTLIAYVIR